MKIVDNLFVKVRKLWNAMFGRNGDGSEVKLIKANPTTAETDPYLSGIEVSGQKYRVLADPDVVQAFVLEYLTDNPDAFEEAIAPLIAPEWDEYEVYKVGNLLTYLGKQYYCIKDATAGTLPTNTTYFEEKSVANIIEMIKNGSIVTGHADVADNLTPYSEDSGTTQENPFISQGTGTDNNSVIVTTGVIARQLEKQGNTIAWNQMFSSLPATQTINGVTLTNNGDGTITLNGTSTDRCDFNFTNYIDVIEGHKYFFKKANNVLVHDGEWKLYSMRAGSESVATASSSGHIAMSLSVMDANLTFDNVTFRPTLTDITYWDSSIITDLTSHPEHFSWYYNGSLAYDAGSLQNCNGRYLECGQGRQLWDEEWENGYIDASGNNQSSNDYIRSKNFFIVVPNREYYIYIPSGSALYFTEYDANGNFIKQTYKVNGTTIVTQSNTSRVRFYMGSSYGTTYKNDITISLYYSPEEGGEGYNQHYDYIPPIRIDTGNETLKAFDKKLPSGVISGNTGEVTFDGSNDENWQLYGSAQRFLIPVSDMKPSPSVNVKANIKCNRLQTVPKGAVDSYDMVISGTDQGGKGIIVRINSTIDDVTKLRTWLASNPLTVQYELETPTTEQGTPFSEYAPINDYSYMAWFDSDGNLVSIPQGCKLFYPVDYKGFVDDLVMYTNGDATGLAKGEDITDTALAERGYNKTSDLSDSITDVAGLSYYLKKAYKCGNVITLTIRGRNGTGSTIAGGSSLFSVPSGCYSTSYSLRFNVNIFNSNNETDRTDVCLINTDGTVKVKSDLASNDNVTILLSYAIE